MKVFPIVCQLTSLFISNVIGKHKAFFHYNVTQVLDDKFSNFSSVKSNCQVNTREAPCDLTPTCRWFVLSEIDRAFLQLQIVNTKTGKKFIDQHVNICTLQSQPGLNIFTRLYFDQLKECINFDIGCPMRTGLYEVKKFQFNSAFDLLLNFFILRDPYSLKLILKNKFGKKMETLYTFSVFFEVIEIDD